MYIIPLYINLKLMRSKNWVEFQNEPIRNEENKIKKDIKRINKINVYKQKKGKKGKTVTIISGLCIDDSVQAKNFLKKLKVLCGTGGKFSNNDFQLQGDLVDKVKSFLREDNYQI